ncbi:hypothetical protein LDENG_00252610 [Lucifuga dentata]|nr:hypothetical protein LDENG_00252610 [Lucifuga dentata]
MAFAQSYLSRVREALQDVPEKMKEFLSLLNEFEHVEGGDVAALFRKLRSIMGDRTELLRDFAAFLHPEQALECGLLEEQQAFERSRRFLRQLEISFGDNPSHYQKIIRALQASPEPSTASIQELKAQMDSLLKGHTHLQAEFWVFFDELRPPPAHPGQFEEAHWPEEGGGGSQGGESFSLEGVASSGFEEVTLPDLEEEEEGLKIQPMASRHRRRKTDSHSNYKECDWSDKDWPCCCHDAKIRRHRRKGCSRCHGNKRATNSQTGSTHQPGDKELDNGSPQQEHSVTSWEGSFHLAEEKEEDEEEEEEEEEEIEEDEEDEEEEEEDRKNRVSYQSPELKRIRREKETLQSPICTSSAASFTSAPIFSSSITCSTSSSVSSSSSSSCAPPPRPSPPSDLPVCAKNISLTASGERVILWTREADRVILTTCQQEGANQSTFQAISSLLGNKTPSEVSGRFRDLMCLFHTAARLTSSEDEAPPP